MADVLSVLFKIGHLPHMKKPEPAAIQDALRSFLYELVNAPSRATELGIPSDTAVKYEVKWLKEIVEQPDEIPVHLSVRGPKHLAEPLHEKLKAGLVEGRWAANGADFSKFADRLGIPRKHPIRFKLYVRSPTGERFDP